VGLKHSVTDLGFRAMSWSHRAVLHLSGGRLLARAFGMPTVELRARGRSSGKVHATMLTAPIIDGDRVVLVASKGGDERDPDWYRNVVANPDVEVTVAGSRRAMRARVATPEEKAAMWPTIVGAYKGYAGYQRRTSREIPVVICEPR